MPLLQIVSLSFCLQGISLDHLTEFRLRISPSATPPQIAMDSAGDLYYSDYWSHKIYKVRGLGSALEPGIQLLREGFGRPGYGPGELHKPLRLTVLQKCRERERDVLLVLLGDGQLLTFDTESGDFIKKIHPFFPGRRLLDRQDGTFFVLGRLDNNHFFHHLRDDGALIESALPVVPDPEGVHSSRHAAALGSDGTVYYQEGTYPHLLVIKQNRRPSNWRLKLPRHYREPPAKRLNPALRFDRTKVHEFYQSFTQLNGLAIVRNGKTNQDKYLAVQWELHQPHLASVDIYSLPELKLLASDQEAPGALFGARGDDLYFLEDRESREGDVEHWVVVFRNRPTPSIGSGSFRRATPLSLSAKWPQK